MINSTQPVNSPAFKGGVIPGESIKKLPEFIDKLGLTKIQQKQIEDIFEFLGTEGSELAKKLPDDFNIRVEIENKPLCNAENSPIHQYNVLNIDFKPDFDMFKNISLFKDGWIAVDIPGGFDIFKSSFEKTIQDIIKLVEANKTEEIQKINPFS